MADSLSQINPATLKAGNFNQLWICRYGTVTGLGFFSISGYEVSILWDECCVCRNQGGISDKAWEIFKLAFVGSGRIAVLGDKRGTEWMFDYRFLEAQCL